MLNRTSCPDSVYLDSSHDQERGAVPIDGFQLRVVVDLRITIFFCHAQQPPARVDLIKTWIDTGAEWPDDAAPSKAGCNEMVVTDADRTPLVVPRIAERYRN